mmetsp:Transcript_86795/g.265687  ORF Transcript_86795/g.265687 Transcript_86795/m.265687 type:complete len:253 (+) Transcript_86795:870-1628(+)
MDHVVHATDVDVLVIPDQAHRLRLQLDHTAQHLAVLDRVDVAVAARHRDPVLDFVQAQDGHEGRHRVELHLRCDVQRGSVQDVNHPVLRADHEHADGRGLVHVLLEHLHARDGGLLLPQGLGLGSGELRLHVRLLHGQEVDGLVRQHGAALPRRGEPIVGRPDVDGVLLQLVPNADFRGRDLDGRQRELQVWPHVPVNEDLVPAGDGQGGYRRIVHLVVKDLDSARDVQQPLLPLDDGSFVDPHLLGSVYHD